MVQPEPQQAQLWKDYFIAVLAGAIKIWISIACVRKSTISLSDRANNSGRLCFTRRNYHRLNEYTPTYAHSLIGHHSYRKSLYVCHGRSPRRVSQLQHESRDFQQNTPRHRYLPRSHKVRDAG